MIIGIGCDIVEHEISKRLNWDSDFSVLKRIFSQKEVDIYSFKKNIQFLAGRFAAKEAVLKCLGTGMEDGLALSEIQILQKGEKPEIVLLGKVREISDRMKIRIWHISISHSNEHSIAFVIAEN